MTYICNVATYKLRGEFLVTYCIQANSTFNQVNHFKRTSQMKPTKKQTPKNQPTKEQPKKTTKKAPKSDPLFYKYLADESKYYPRSWSGY